MEIECTIHDPTGGEAGASKGKQQFNASVVTRSEIHQTDIYCIVHYTANTYKK
jgi:hypothetical protein